MTDNRTIDCWNLIQGAGLLVFAFSLGLGCVQPEQSSDASGVIFTAGGSTGGAGAGGTDGDSSGGDTSGDGSAGDGGDSTVGDGNSGDGNGATASLEEGVFATPLDFIEAPGLIGPCFANLCPGSAAGTTADSTAPQLLVTLSGAQGDIIFDLQSRTTVLDFAPGDSAGDGAFGWVPISQPNPGPSTPAALFRFDQAPGSFGGTLTNYRVDDGEFGGFSQLLIGSYLDALTAGNRLDSGEILACSDRGPLSIQFDANTQSFNTVTEPDGSVSRFDVGRGCVSMVTDTANGPVLSVSRTQGGFADSRLYYVDRNVQVTEVGILGVDARRIRHFGGIAATTLFADDALRIITWDGQNSPTIVGPLVPVGDGPVGLDLRDAGGGAVQIVSTGFNDNSIAVTTVAADGSVTGNTVYGAPGGCAAPAHAIFIENADNAGDPFVMATCFSTGNYIISKVSSLTPAAAP